MRSVVFLSQVTLMIANRRCRNEHVRHLSDLSSGTSDWHVSGTWLWFTHCRLRHTSSETTTTTTTTNDDVVVVVHRFADLRRRRRLTSTLSRHQLMTGAAAAGQTARRSRGLSQWTKAFCQANEPMQTDGRADEHLVGLWASVDRRNATQHAL